MFGEKFPCAHIFSIYCFVNAKLFRATRILYQMYIMIKIIKAVVIYTISTFYFDLIMTNNKIKIHV